MGEILAMLNTHSNGAPVKQLRIKLSPKFKVRLSLAHSAFLPLLIVTNTGIATEKTLCGKAFDEKRPAVTLPFLPAKPFQFTLLQDTRPVFLAGNNYILTPKENGTVAVRENLDGIAAEIFSREPRIQAQIDQALRIEHERRENSFRKKNPENGNYNTVFTPEINGIVVPISKRVYDASVRSTEPMLRALRSILQHFYATGSIFGSRASQQKNSALTLESVKRIDEIFKSSVYYEPQVHDPRLKDYPFLPIAGFDMAVSDPSQASGAFFEFNLGTPSGLSNNIQLTEALRRIDPALFHTFKDHLPDDRTFSILKSTMERCAKSWTKSDGLTIMVSPGALNGAHPDVSYIANFSGLPLVNLSDLYFDESGYLRIDQGRGARDQRVTGIYSRAEESYVLNSPAHKIPIRGPYFAQTNRQLNRQEGLHLDESIGYQYRYNKIGEVIGVDRDKNSEPIFQQSWDRIADKGFSGTILQAIHSRKLYLSSLGGRVADDKRIFQILAEILASEFPGETVAHPPSSLSKKELEEFFAGEGLERFVVKEPDKSGADGIFILNHLKPEERSRIVKTVKENVGKYVIQKFIESAFLLSANSDIDDYDTRIADWRLFVFFDEAGNARADPQSLLLRIASKNSTVSNTSAGGGYGIGLVLNSAEKMRDPNVSLLPSAPLTDAIGVNKRQQLQSYFYQIKALRESLVKQKTELDLEGAILAQRTVLDLLGRDYAPLITAMREFQHAKISAEMFVKTLDEAIIKMLSGSGFTDLGVRPVANQILGAQ